MSEEGVIVSTPAESGDQLAITEPEIEGREESEKSLPATNEETAAAGEGGEKEKEIAVATNDQVKSDQVAQNEAENEVVQNEAEKHGSEEATTAATSGEPESVGNVAASDEKAKGDEDSQNEGEKEGLAGQESGVGVTRVENAVDSTLEIEREGLETSKVLRATDAEAGDAQKSPPDPTQPAVSTITYHDLGYEVTQRKFFKRLPNKIILDSVSGEMKIGVNAIMGPTGSGKTTLLDLLADRKDKSGKSGKVLINGQKRQANYKTMVGYVVQDDVVMGTLSVRENLAFSAALRLPGHMTRVQRKERVERVIETLGLYRCADTKVGTEFFRGVSGGERKRTNIGMELIIEPQVLFLDEPTTGLDAHTAVSVVSLLKNLSVNEKRMIVLSIHQPRYSIFKLFDSLTLLSQGSTVYHGPTSLALSYFDKLGLTCEEHENPADFFLDTIIQFEKRLRESSQETVLFSKAAVGDDEEGAESADGVVLSPEGGDEMVKLVERYRESEEYQELRKRIDPVLQNVVEEKRKEPLGRQVARKLLTRELYATSFLWQLLIVTMRSAKNLLRSPQLSVFQFVFTSILAIIIGIIFWQLDTDTNGFIDRVGVFFFISVNQSFGSLGAIQLFIQQKALFIHENGSGYYRVSAFFISKIATDLIPLRFLPNVLFVVIVYFMIGFQVKADKFFIFWLILMLVQICAVSIAFFISAGVRNGEIANVLIILPLIFSLLFGGLLISLDSLPVWVAWLRHFSFIKYAIEGFSINEMDGLRFQGPCQVEQVFNNMEEEEGCTANSTFTTPNNCTSECAFDGLAQLGQLGYGNTTSVLWWDVFALVLYSSIFLLLAYLVLRLIKKEK